MDGAEDMIVDHNMVVTQVFRRLGKRLDRSCIAAKFDLRINHTSFHRLLPLSRCEVLRQIQTIHVRSGSSSPKHRRITLAATRSQITRRDDDRELQTEQRIVGLPARKLQPDRTDARSWFGMTFAKETPAWRATPAVRFRRLSPVASRPGEGRLTDPIAGAQAWRPELVFMPQGSH